LCAGGINQAAGGESIPGIQRTYGPGTVVDWDLGMKYAFDTGPVQARLNVAAYRANLGMRLSHGVANPARLSIIMSAD